MTSTKHLTDRGESICGSHCSLGLINYTNVLSDPMHQNALLKVTKSAQLEIFSRAAIGSQVFHSLQHTQTKKCNNYTVSYHHDDEPCCGEIMYFVTDFSSIFTVVAPFVDSRFVFPEDKITNCTLPHIHAFATRSQNTVHVKELSRVSLCISMAFSDDSSVIFVAQ